MSLKNGTYQLQFIPAGGEPDLGELLATGEAMSRPVRLLPNTPPYFSKQHVSVLDTCHWRRTCGSFYSPNLQSHSGRLPMSMMILT